MTDLGNEDIDQDGPGWECPYCGWSGDKAPLHKQRFEVHCPECGAMIDDSISRTLEESDEWERGDNE